MVAKRRCLQSESTLLLALLFTLVVGAVHTVVKVLDVSFSLRHITLPTTDLASDPRCSTLDGAAKLGGSILNALSGLAEALLGITADVAWNLHRTVSKLKPFESFDVITYVLYGLLILAEILASLVVLALCERIISSASYLPTLRFDILTCTSSSIAGVLGHVLIELVVVHDDRFGDWFSSLEMN